jgi:hypothetical protein
VTESDSSDIAGIKNRIAKIKPDGPIGQSAAAKVLEKIKTLQAEFDRCQKLSAKNHQLTLALGTWSHARRSPEGKGPAR